MKNAAILPNIQTYGPLLRILRDNASLSRQAYVEFNLQDIFAGASFSELALLWLCAHHSPVRTDNQPPEICWLELWSRQARNASAPFSLALHL